LNFFRDQGRNVQLGNNRSRINTIRQIMNQEQVRCVECGGDINPFKAYKLCGGNYCVMAKTVMSCGKTYKNRYVPGKDEKYYTRDETNKLIELLQKKLFQMCADTSTCFEIIKDFRTTVCHILKEQYGGFIDGWELVTEEHTFLQLVGSYQQDFRQKPTIRSLEGCRRALFARV